MRRPLPGPSTVSLAFAAGVAAFFLNHHPPPGKLVLLGFILIAASALRFAWLRLPAIAALGFACAYWAACGVLCPGLPETLIGKDLLVQGRLASLPEASAERARFTFAVEQASLDGQPIQLPRRIRLNWYQHRPELEAGAEWQLMVRLKPPHGFVNPGGFDYERWLFQQGIGATGYVRDSGQNRLLDSGPGRYRLTRLRQRLRDRIDGILGDTRSAALVRALALGDRDGLTPDDWQVLTRTGTNHLMAISGLHIGLIAGTAFLIGRWCWARAGSLSLLIAAPRAGAVAALVSALAYSALAGFAISTQRALVMLAVVLIALLCRRTLRPWSALSVALAAVLLIDPLALLSYGFWLSFGAVAVLLFALTGRLGAPRWFARWSHAQWAVALGLLPLLLLLFGRASVLAPAVNLFAVPLFSLLLPVVLAATLISIASGWELPLVLVAAGLDGLFGVLDRLAQTPWATLGLAARPLWAWIAAFAGVLLLLAPRGLPGRWLGLIWLLPIALLRPPAPAIGTALVDILDVGQGLAVVVRTHGHTLVYDLGPRFPSGFNTGSAVVAPSLRSRGVRRVDRLIVSHGDTDHAGGLAGFLAEIEVTEIDSGEPGELPLTQRPAASIKQCRAGDHWEWDGVRFRILHPEQSGYQGNDSSCVLRIETDAASLLLTGDATRRVEATLLERMPARLRADLLVAGHHGSATSTSGDFLRQVAPSWVIYSAGFANRYRFPSSEVHQRVRAMGIPTLNTAQAGGIEFLLPAEPPLREPRLSRQSQDRLWRHHPAAESQQPPE